MIIGSALELMRLGPKLQTASARFLFFPKNPLQDDMTEPRQPDPNPSSFDSSQQKSPAGPSQADSRRPVPPGSGSAEESEAARFADEADEKSRLEAELATLKAKSGDLAEQYLRAKAEAENARRRADEEVAKARKFALEAFAESLLPVLDSLEAGLAIKEATAQQIREGSEATLRQLAAALERNKVVPIDPKPGEKFDPSRHHAISIVPAPEGAPQEPNSVVAVLQKGYTIAERVLRPALVTVTAQS